MKLRLRVATMVALLVGAGLVAPVTADSAPLPSVVVGVAPRGGIADLTASGLTPGSTYDVRADLPGFAGANTTTAVADPDGRFRARFTIPTDVPLATTGYHVAVSPHGSTDALTATNAVIDAPTLYVDLGNGGCAGGPSARLEPYGFPFGTYHLSSPDAAISPATITYDATHPIPVIWITIAAGTADGFPATAVRSGDETRPITSSLRGSPAYVNHTQGPLQEQTTAVGECFHPNSIVTLTSRSPGVTLPSTVRTDAKGHFTFFPRPLAYVAPRFYFVTATDAAGSTAVYEGRTWGTAVRAAAVDPVITSPHVLAQNRLDGCNLEVDHWYLSGGQWTYAWPWYAEPRSNLRGCHLLFRSDGLLAVMYGSRAVWTNGAQLTGSGNTLTLEDTGNLVERTSAGQVVWPSRAGRHVLATDQSLYAGQSLQWSETVLTMQTNGNLVLRVNGTGAWNAHTSGTGATHLTVRSNGNLTLKTAAGRSVWSSDTLSSGTANHLVVYSGHAAVVTREGHVVWRA